MATETTRRCDIYGTRKGVHTYRLRLERISDDAPLLPGDPPPDETMRDVQLDLCTRGYKRLLNFLTAGTTKPDHEKINGALPL